MGTGKFASAPADAGEAPSSASAPAVPKRGKAMTKDSPVADGAPWYALTAAVAASKLSKTDLAKAAARDEAVYVKSVEAWERAKKKGETGDDRYMAQVAKSGTFADKMAALTLQIQESPQQRLPTLDALLSLAKSGRRSSKMAIESLKDLFVNTLLPDQPCRAVAAQVCDVCLDATLFAAVFEEKLAAVASSLCGMYVALFSTAVKAVEVHTRMLSALLAGINRALSYCDYAKQKDQALDLDALYRISHDGAFATRV
ncbi:hypothetical protein M885DRAFT_499518 [Pelagophyceae sp. CCMP2097]|nr:hypothetical protein M885DRAFT_499518 [Pelagophyceae sp. CCMP2097]